MPLSTEAYTQLKRFFAETAFADHGAVITDLDGTAIHEWAGRYCVPPHVEQGLKAVYRSGRPVVINTLRFPLSVMRTFGREWYKISGAPIDTVLLNGAMLGCIHEDDAGAQRYEELEAFPMDRQDIRRVLHEVEILNRTMQDSLLVFYYPRDWIRGEIIWTPFPVRIPAVQEKYKSAELVWSGSMAALDRALMAEEICMVHLFADARGDGRMAYQHTTRRDFYTQQGVDKLSGTQRIAELLGFRLDASLGAGDSSMDVFLRGVAQAVHVGKPLEFKSVLPPILAGDSEAFAALLADLAVMMQIAKADAA